MSDQESELAYAINELNVEMQHCRKCSTVNHSQIYPGIYRKPFKYFFVGAAPWNLDGPEEAFMVGKASANFDKFLQLAGIQRSECYVTNAVVHIPIQHQGKSRQPNIIEIEKCSTYLQKQIDLLKPKLIIALGGTAVHALDIIEQTNIFSVTRSVRKLHKWYGRYLMVCTHPSPMAVSFRDEDQQKLDYEQIRINYEQI